MYFCRLKLGRNVSALLNSDLVFYSVFKHRNVTRFVSVQSHNELIGRVHHYSTDSDVSSSNAKQKSNKWILKTPKGTRDHDPQQMTLRRNVFEKIETVFRTHGAEAIDTPVFELKDLLTDQYGEGTKLIYDLADQGGEILALRYDLTVPFARYLAMNKITNIKRYQIGKVYRRDTPSIVHGRYREFYQCDYDIAGTYDPMLPDAECVKVLTQILNSLDIGEFVIKLNHRQLLNGLFEACGVPKDSFIPICSAIDKLDKLSWSEVRREMVEEKGLTESVADKIGEYIQLVGQTEQIDRLLENEFLNRCPSAVKGLKDLKLLFHYCKLLGIEGDVVFDLSLARGLEYYTGVIFEAVLKDKNVKRSKESMGSIAAGGRYDDLIGLFDAKGRSVPCVGISIGVERIFSILESKYAKNALKLASRADVYVISAHKGLHEERLKIVNRLWNAGIRSEHSFKENPKILHQIQYCEKHEVPFAIIIGDSELKNNVVKLRTISSREEYDVPIADLEAEIKKRISQNK